MTAAAVYWARITLRRHWRSSVATALLVAVACSIPMVAAAGARRTASVVGRASAALLVPDVQMQLASVEDQQIAALRAMPGVDLVGRHSVVFLRPSGTDLKPFLDFFGIASYDGVWGYDMAVPRVDSGRLPSPSEAHEVLVSRALADRLDLEPGDHFSVDTLTWESVVVFFETGGIPEPDGPVVDLAVTGIGLAPAELVSSGQIPNGTIVFTPAFLQRYPQVAAFSDLIDVALADGPNAVEDFIEATRALLGQEVIVTPIAQELDQLRAGVDVQRTALLLFLLVSAVAALAVLVQIATRTAERHSASLATLEALGLGTRSRLLAVGVLFGPVALAGIVVGVAASIAVSSVLPFGIGGRLEPDPGIHADWLVLVAGAIVTALAALGAVGSATIAADRRRARTTTRARPPWAARLARPMRLPMTIGTRWALVPGRGRHAVPVRSALVGTVIGVAGTVGAIVFGASLDRLLDTPARYGVTHDIEVGVTGDESTDEDALAAMTDLAERPKLSAVTFVRASQLSLLGETRQVFGIESVSGDVGYTILEGRAPATPGEAVVGSALLDDLGLEIGDQLTLEGGTVGFEIVGRGAFPPLDDGNSVASAIGFTRLGLVAARADLPQEAMTGGFPQALVSVARGLDVEQMQAALEEEFGFSRITQKPTSVANVGEAGSVPWLLAGFLGVLGVLALAHTVGVTASRRRRDLAVLRCIGFTGRDLATTATAHTFAVIAAGAIFGLPLGVVAGSFAWRVVADGIGVATDAAAVWTSVGLVLGSSVVIGALIAIPWARSAARTRAARTLHAE